MMNRILCLLFLLLNFQLVYSQNYPQPRDHFAATFDSHRGKLIVFGGNGESDDGYLSDIWEYDGTWRKVNEGEKQARSSHMMVYLSHFKKSLLLGGISKEGEYIIGMGFWDGSNWSEVPDGPSPRYSPGIAYDESRKTVVLFSGAGRGDDTMWEYAAGEWKSIELGGDSPILRTRTQMVYDYARESVILFGGYADGKSHDDMWEWDGAKWTRLDVEVPPARNNHLMVSDKQRKKVVLFGGKYRQNNVLHRDTWEWDGSKWELVSESGPEPRDMMAGAFDENLNQVVIFGGRDENRGKLNDMWGWDGKKWTRLD